jgi:glycine dehydrogenase subunit 2
MKRADTQLVFDMSVKGRRAYSFGESGVPRREPAGCLPADMLRAQPPALPELSEVDVVRHFTRLSQENYGVDEGFYPLGSCTMKYNPKVNEDIAALPGFTGTHPLARAEDMQGCLEVMYELCRFLEEITGMERVSLEPAAGAHGELTGLMMIKAYHLSRGDTARTKILVPDSAHGTNPASAMCAGFSVVAVKSDERGNIDLDSLRAAAGPDTAGLMLTNPNTLGFFDEHIAEIAEIIHRAGGLLYYDGANLNAVVGCCRPGDMGFDVVHLNLHKTFSTPHGGGGPGSGPVGVKKALVPFLPKPLITKNGEKFALDYDRPQSIGQVRSFYGNFGVALRAWAYILTMGGEGLREVSRAAVLNANYVRAKLAGSYEAPFGRACMHETVLSGEKLREKYGVSTLDVAKRLLDYGFHPPTIYFPLIVHEAIMIEPTETESKETLDAFIDAMLKIAAEAETDPEKVKTAPHETLYGRFDETLAARTPVLSYGDCIALKKD